MTGQEITIDSLMRDLDRAIACLPPDQYISYMAFALAELASYYQADLDGSLTELANQTLAMLNAPEFPTRHQSYEKYVSWKQVSKIQQTTGSREVAHLCVLFMILTAELAGRARRGETGPNLPPFFNGPAWVNTGYGTRRRVWDVKADLEAGETRLLMRLIANAEARA
jgi:hypothetical protein